MKFWGESSTYLVGQVGFVFQHWTLSCIKTKPRFHWHHY